MGFSLSQCSLKPFKWTVSGFSVEFGEVNMWQNQRGRLVHFYIVHSSPPVKAQTTWLSPFWKDNFSDSAAACSPKPASFSFWGCMSWCVCSRVCVCHRLNLHGDDVPFSQAPAGIRGGGGGGTGFTQWVKRGGKNMKTAAVASPGVGGLKRIRLPKIIQLHLPFGITQGAAA